MKKKDLIISAARDHNDIERVDWVRLYSAHMSSDCPESIDEFRSIWSAVEGRVKFVGDAEM